jgi:hypothetical protein
MPFLSPVSESDAFAAVHRLSCEVAETRKTSPGEGEGGLESSYSSWWWQQPNANPPSKQSVYESAFAIEPISEVEEGSVDSDPALSDANPTPSRQSRAVTPPSSIMGCDANSPAMRRLAACLLCDDIAAAQRIIALSRSTMKGGGKGGGMRPQSNRTTTSFAGFPSSAAVVSSPASAAVAAASTVSLLMDCSLRLGGGKTGGGGVVSAGRGGDATKLVVRLAANDLFASSAAAVGLVSLLRARNVRHVRRLPRNAAGSLALKAVRAAEAEKNAETRGLEDVDRLKRAALALAQFRLTIGKLRISLN